MNFNKTIKSGFTLAEVLITLGIIGVVAALTIPVLMNAYQNMQMVSGVKEFSSILENAVRMWKLDINCTDSAYNCLAQQNLPDDTCSNIDQLVKQMRIVSSFPISGAGTPSWLPIQTLDYSGTAQTGTFGGVSLGSTDMCRYLLANGMTMAIDPDQTRYKIQIDINGKTPPNRMGKDTFPFTVGFLDNTDKRDIFPYPMDANSDGDTTGLCSLWDIDICNPNNVNPSLSGGASITAYVLFNSKIPNYYP